jgi:hypothetical protein
VHLLVRDARLGAMLTRVLTDAGWRVDAEPSLPYLWTGVEATGGLAVLDWTMADGLLSEEHRRDLSRLARRIPLVVLVPEGWLRRMSAEDFGVAALVPKGWATEALLPALEELVGEGGRPHVLPQGA